MDTWYTSESGPFALWQTWAWLAFSYLTGHSFYGEMVQASGEWAIWCLMATLAVR